LDLFDVQILIKTKHSINNNSYPNDYINYINAIDSNKVSFINPRFSPKLLASISDFSISAPFTTAAFFKTKTNNNIFYDSENIIFKDDRARQNLNVINGYNELLTSVSKIINNIKSSK
jgi:polysaccharide biosynthesis PFTS motif protein